MTSKFEDLMYLSGLTAQGSWDNLDTYDREAFLRFGQLLVRQCASIAGHEYAATSGESSGESAILKHFGVE